MSIADKIAFWSLVVGIAASFIAVLSLIIAVYAIRKGNRNSSIATMLMISEAAREAWKRFLPAKDDDARSYELAELMNLIEVACAMLDEGSIVGVSKRLLQELMKQELALIDGNERATREIGRLMSEPHTFEYIRKFKSARLHDAPRFWYRIVLVCIEKVKLGLSTTVRLCLYK